MPLEFEEDSEVIEVSNKAIVNKKGEWQGSDLQCQGQSHRCMQTCNPGLQVNENIKPFSNTLENQNPTQPKPIC